MDTSLYQPTLTDEQSVRDWVARWTPLGGFPHPDDHAVVLDPAGDEKLGIVGPAFPPDLDLALARAYDASLDVALTILEAAGVDIYDVINTADMDHRHILADDESVTVYLKVTLAPTDVVNFTVANARAAILARLDEVYPVEGYPVVPVVEIIDGLADLKRDAVFDPAADLALLGITLDASPADLERYAALINLMATYAHDVWTDETHGVPWVREDVEEWFAEVVNFPTTKERDTQAYLEA